MDAEEIFYGKELFGQDLPRRREKQSTPSDQFHPVSFVLFGAGEEVEIAIARSQGKAELQAVYYPQNTNAHVVVYSGMSLKEAVLAARRQLGEEVFPYSYEEVSGQVDGTTAFGFPVI